MPESIVAGKVLLIEGSRILDILDSPTATDETYEIIDVQNRWICPGLMDIHIHGAVGQTFNDPNETAYTTITKNTAARGITALLATLAAAPIPQLVECLDFNRKWLCDSPNRPREGSQILGVHLEGPYFSIEQRGAQDLQSIRNPNDGTVDDLLRYHDVIKIMTFAPELPGALDLTARLQKLGIIPAAGHSSAKDSDVLAAMERGLRHIIHIWSGQSTTIREGAWRKPGLLEASLTFDGLTVEMISDNKHLPATLMKLAYKCIGPDRLCAISDATSGAGLPDGARFRIGAPEFVVQDGVGMTLDGTSFAGSTTFLNQMIPVLRDVVGIPLPEAVRMASLTPAKVLGLAHAKGSLEAGKDADIVIFNDDFTVWRTMIGGLWVSGNV